ncbi:MAG: TonB-dependent receptor [Carboxylicivirga sp.]|nr:TonB-dependent receptor [Carboxylicivirga sp.]MCT4643692.1 TonB-dependent receptor [Carboxylicivirga sp.]
MRWETHGIKRMMRVMKLSFLLLLIGFLQMSAKSYGQKEKLTLKMQDVSAQEVFKQLEHQAGLKFFYQDEQLSKIGHVSIDASEQSLNDVLSDLLDQTGLTFKLIDNHVIILAAESNSNKSSAQQEKETIKGLVTDKNGDAIPGVNVFEKSNPQNGVITGVDGSYSLSVSNSDAIISFSFIGFETQDINVAGRKTIDIVLLQDMENIDEVVVVGYGTQKKINTTGAVSQIEGDVLESRPITNVADGLSNRVAGLNVTKTNGAPGSSASWNIRGFTGLSKDQWGNVVATTKQPLILVDGIEQNPDVLNPEDIESISVLKDASASAIYGSRAPYGVVIITTKSGSKGKMSINYNNNFSWKSMTDVPQPVDGLTFAKAFNEAYNNARQPAVFSDETLGKIEAYMNGTGPNNTIGNDGLWRQWTESHGNTDWMKEWFNDNSFSQSHNVALSGGVESGKLDYYASFGYSEDNGILKHVPKDEYNRYNFSIKVRSQINKWVQTTANVRYSQRNYSRSNIDDNTVLNQVARLWPTTPAVNPDGVEHRNNLYWPLKSGGYYDDVQDDLTSRLEVKITPFEGFNIVGSASYSKFYKKFKRNRFNYKVPQPGDNYIIGGNMPNSVEEEMRNDDYLQMEAYMSYERLFGKHFMKVLAGHQSEEKNYHTLYGSKAGLITQNVPSISTATGTVNLDDALGHWSTEGYFFRVNYNYEEKYLLEVNGRYDASSRFPSHTRWAFFPSFSLGWNVAKENFWPIAEVNTFKLRGSYGKLGNANVANYLYLPQMNYYAKGGVMLGNENASRISMPGILSPDITWEKPEVINVGFDAAAFNNRLNVSYEWFQRTIKDQISPPVEASAVLGTNPPDTNNGVSETRGWELTINWRDRLGSIMGKEVKYGVGFNISDYIGYVVKYPNTTGSYSGIWTAGERFGDILGYETVGIASDINQYNNAASHHRLWSQSWHAGDIIYKDQDGDGKIDSGNSRWYNKGDLVNLGNTTPRYQYGFNLEAQWNGFDINMFFEGVGKQDLTMSGMYFWGITGSQWHSSLFDHNNDYWSPTNTDAYFPRIYFGGESGKNQQTQSKYVINGAYMRFKTLQLGYNLPASWLNKIGLNNCRIFTSIENVGMIYKASKLDLDPVILRSNSGQIYPPQRTISLGLNVGF